MSRMILAALVMSMVGLWLNSARAEEPAALSEIVSNEFVDTPQEETLHTLAKAHKISIRPGWAALADVGVSNDEPITPRPTRSHWRRCWN